MSVDWASWGTHSAYTPSLHCISVAMIMYVVLRSIMHSSDIHSYIIMAIVMICIITSIYSCNIHSCRTMIVVIVWMIRVIIVPSTWIVRVVIIVTPYHNIWFSITVDSVPVIHTMVTIVSTVVIPIGKMSTTVTSVFIRVEIIIGKIDVVVEVSTIIIIAVVVAIIIVVTLVIIVKVSITLVITMVVSSKGFFYVRGGNPCGEMCFCIANAFFGRGLFISDALLSRANRDFFS